MDSGPSLAQIRPCSQNIGRPLFRSVPAATSCVRPRVGSASNVQWHYISLCEGVVEEEEDEVWEVSLSGLASARLGSDIGPAGFEPKLHRVGPDLARNPSAWPLSRTGFGHFPSVSTDLGPSKERRSTLHLQTLRVLRSGMILGRHRVAIGDDREVGGPVTTPPQARACMRAMRHSRCRAAGRRGGLAPLETGGSGHITSKAS